MAGEVLGGGHPLQSLGEVGLGDADVAIELLQAARGADHPTSIAEIASDLTPDRGHRVRREHPLDPGGVSPDRLDQPQHCDLNQILRIDPTPLVLLGQGPGHRLVQKNSLFAKNLSGGRFSGVRCLKEKAARALVSIITNIRLIGIESTNGHGDTPCVLPATWFEPGPSLKEYAMPSWLTITYDGRSLASLRVVR